MMSLIADSLMIIVVSASILYAITKNQKISILLLIMIMTTKIMTQKKKKKTNLYLNGFRQSKKELNMKIN